MTTYTSRTDIMVQGKVESSAQGKLIGAVDTMPAAKDYTDGVVVLFTGTTTDTYVKGRYYRSNGIAWSEADFNLAVDSTPTSGSGNPVSSSGVYDALEGKQDNLVFDTAPKSGSLNPVTSGGLHVAFSNKLDKTGTAARATADASGKDITTTYATKTEVNAKQDALSFDAAPTSNSTNPVTSNGIYKALANKVDVVSGKGLSTNDYTTDEKNKLTGIAVGAQANVIETVKVNGTALTPSNKVVNIDLSNYATKADVTSVYKVKGSIAYVDLIAKIDAKVGDVYNVTDKGGMNYVCTVAATAGADSWDPLGSTFDASGLATTEQVNAKQDALTAGAGISLSGSTIALATSGVTAGSKGSATTVPVITVDKYGRVTALSTSTIYPPTSNGTSGQIWTSKGNGQGEWKSKSTSPTNGSADAITSGAVYTALSKKQNALSFDSAPVENSSNPVTSGGLYTMKANLEQAIAAAGVNITGAATTIVSNDLTASRALISNASGKVAVSTVTSTELGYLSGVTSAIQTQLNSKLSTIPAAGSSTQPVYINSSGTPTACNYTLGAAAAKAVTTSVTSGSTSLVTSGGVYTAVNAKQDKLTFDSAPTSGSSNPVTSGGIYTAIEAKQSKLTFDSTPTSGSNNPVKSSGIFTAINAKQDKLTFDSTPKSGSNNPVTSGGIYSAINRVEQKVPSGGTAGQVWVSDGEGAGVWADPSSVGSSYSIVKYNSYQYPVPVMAGDEYSTDEGQTWNTAEADGQLAKPFTGLVRYKKVAEGDMPAYSRSASNLGRRLTGNPILTSGRKATLFKLGGKAYICDNGTKVDVYDAEQNVTAGTPMSLAGSAKEYRGYHTSAVLGDKAYVFTVTTGSKSSDNKTSYSSSAVDVYDVNGNRTNITFDVGSIRISNDTIWYATHQDMASLVIGNKICVPIYQYIYGNNRRTVEKTHTKILDSNGVITEGTALPKGGYYVSSFVIRDKGFIRPGFTGNSESILSIYTYDSNGVVTSATDIPNPYTGSGTLEYVNGEIPFVLDDKGYLCGGGYRYYNSGSTYNGLKRTLIYDYDGNVTTGTDMLTPRGDTDATIIDNKAVICGGVYKYGSSNYAYTNKVEIIDSNGVVSDGGTISNAKAWLVSTVFGDKVYAFGGYYYGNSSESYNNTDIITLEDMYKITYRGVISAPLYSEMEVDGIYTFVDTSSNGRKSFEEIVERIYLKDEVPKTWHYRIKYQNGII